MHLAHKNIIKYCNRPFAGAEEMTESLIRSWNVKVQPEDEVWHLGDFVWGDHMHLYKRLNGKINFVIGNHDKRNRLESVASVYDLKEIYHEKQHIVMCHYAMRVWNKSHHGSWHLYGHSHDTLEHTPWGKSMDVGIDAAYRILGKYEPFSFAEIKRILDKRDIAVVDHHQAGGL